MSVVYIGLGSNLDQPKRQLLQARERLARLPQTRLLKDSGLFQSRAMTLPGDDASQDDYINAVIKLETALSPHQLLDALQAIETEQGRQRLRRWGPRTLDLDILLYDDLQMDDERLTLPHAGIAERDFVLYPLQKIDNCLMIPGVGALDMLLAKISAQNIRYLGAFE
ncbi:MAG: 2-amino-4-hydroxy-6-hydroxymethyldihydropteridine diphosphokinase [Gammaproteobacteria bacterium]|nr:2-amino-4-hydroxy-6-hydroxymethyldihydropteridine diphosphokinase [Gammaproteobacteria bacterium]